MQMRYTEMRLTPRSPCGGKAVVLSPDLGSGDDTSKAVDYTSRFVHAEGPWV